MSELGGEAACWLDRLCDTCGGVIVAGEEHECRRPVRSADRPTARTGDQPAAASRAGRIASSE